MNNMFRHLDLNLLRVFAALMDEGNVTRAAERLSLSQPAVSNALNRLRQTFDDSLFEKTSSGVRPTGRARELWSVIHPHFEALKQAISPEVFSPSKYTGRFTIAMSDYTAKRVMPRLAKFMSEHAPSVRVDLAQYSVVDLPGKFEREGVDLAVGGYLNDASPSSGIRSHMLWPIQWSCLMRKTHPLAATARPGLQRFLSARHVDVLLPGMPLPVYDSLLAAHGHTRNLVLTLNDYLPALEIIAQTDFVAVLPTTLLNLDPNEKRLVSRDPPIRMPARPFCVIWHQRWDSSPPHQWLRETVISLCANEES